jgi:hypothetical protein
MASIAIFTKNDGASDTARQEVQEKKPATQLEAGKEIADAEAEIAKLESFINKPEVRSIMGSQSDRLLADGKHNVTQARRAFGEKLFGDARDFAAAAKRLAILELSRLENSLKTYAPKPQPHTTSTQPIRKEISVEADSRSFYPNSIQVPAGVHVIFTIRVRVRNVPPEGLSFSSPRFLTPTLLPGQSRTVEFTAHQSFTISSYDPSHTTKKADFKVEVK